MDLVSWWPKLRPGGIMAGHDYLPDGTYTEGQCAECSDVTDANRKPTAAPCYCAAHASATLLSLLLLHPLLPDFASAPTACWLHCFLLRLLLTPTPAPLLPTPASYSCFLFLLPTLCSWHRPRARRRVRRQVGGDGVRTPALHPGLQHRAPRRGVAGAQLVLLQGLPAVVSVQLQSGHARHRVGV